MYVDLYFHLTLHALIQRKKRACLIVQDLENKSSYAMEPVNAAKL